MTEARAVMDDFMKKLQADGFVKENQPNNGPRIDAAFVEEQLTSYTKLLELEVLKRALGR